MEGIGKLDLPARRLDYRATAVLVKSCEGQGGKSASELANYPIPVRISGPVDNLKVEPDFTTGLLNLLGNRKAASPPPQTPASDSPAGQTQEQLPPLETPPADPKQQAEEAVKGLLQQGLKGLFN